MDPSHDVLMKDNHVNPVESQIKSLNTAKRTLVTLILKAYFYQLTEGCKNASCTNEYCYMKRKHAVHGQDDARRLALELTKKTMDPKNPVYHFCDSYHVLLPVLDSNGLTFASVKAIQAAYEICNELDDTNYISDLLQRVFSNSDALNLSFYPIEQDKKQPLDFSNDAHVDYEGFYTIMKTLHTSKYQNVGKVIDAALDTLCKKIQSQTMKDPRDLRQFTLLLLCPQFLDPQNHPSLVSVMRAMLQLPTNYYNILKQQFASVPQKLFSKMVELFQQYITLQLYAVGFIDERIAYATRSIGVLCEANELKPNVADQIPYNEFYNDAVNGIVDLKHDYLRWKANKQSRAVQLGTFEEFSFTTFPFILDPASKTKILQIDAAQEQNQEFRKALYSSLFMSPQSFFLEIRVKRDNLLATALNEITSKLEELKKPLKVTFVGEEGVDEGGVRKEFFQLIVRQIFDVSFAMFTYNEQTRQFWFNPNSLENADEFQLIGTLIGLALYNSVILDVHFPLVVYRKLLGLEPTLLDLKELDPALGKGLQDLLEFEGNVEDTFCRTFQVESEAWGKIEQYDLKPNGGNIAVTNENRKEYVDLYVKWKLTSSVQKQFTAFSKGFHNVIGGPILKLFRPEELELLVCGSPKLDFEALEKATKYADGFSKNSKIIKWFWEILKEYNTEDKKKFLAFCTGSDRVPIKGLGNLQFVVVRNGPDSERLPTAHTCFNILLLPEYATKEKLRQRLQTAINNYEGFGLK